VRQLQSENLNDNTWRVFVDAALAAAAMLVLSVISGFLAATLTGDRTIVISTMGTLFAVIGAGLLFQVWLLSPKICEPRQKLT
jgi:putative Ca2+/H+ antiporter (TMEM165/GDT1 family)